MENKALVKLESMIDFLIEKVDEDSEYLYGDEIEEKYLELKDYLIYVNDSEISCLREGINYDDENEYLAFKKIETRYKQIEKKIKQFADENDLEEGSDSGWMFDKDE